MDLIEIKKCVHCGEIPVSSIRGLGKRLEASIWCPNCIKEEMNIARASSRDFNDVARAMHECSVQWNYRQSK